MKKMTMSVREMADQMGISLPKAYELTKTDGFPVIRVGTRILIPMDAFREWLANGYQNGSRDTRCNASDEDRQISL